MNTGQAGIQADSVGYRWGSHLHQSLRSARIPGFFPQCGVSPAVPQPSFCCSGHFGMVRLCRERSTSTFYAAKFVKMRQHWGSHLGLERAQVEQEVTILRQLHHPNIMRLHDLFTSRAEVVLVLEL